MGEKYRDTTLREKYHMRQLVFAFTLIFGLIFISNCANHESKSESSKPEINKDSLEKMQVTDLIDSKYKFDLYHVEGSVNTYTIQGEKITTDTRILNRVSWKVDQEQFERVVDLLDLNVFDYHSLKDEYSTELQKKVFRDSRDYKNKLNRLKSLRADLINRSYYLDWPLNKENLKYDLYDKTFEVQLIGNNNLITKGLQNIVFDKIFFKLPNGLEKSVKKVEVIDLGKPRPVVPRPIHYNLEQNISLTVNDENTALEIEKNAAEVAILFVFNFMGLDAFQPTTELHYIALYNKSTGEIYKLY